MENLIKLKRVMTKMEIKQELLKVNGLQTRVFTAGESGPAVLLLHGAGTDSASLSWADIILPLAKSGQRVFAPDLPGYGESERPDVSYNLEFSIDFVNELIKTLELKQVSLVGLSMGGAISLGVTLDHQEKVNKLVLVDSYGLQRTVSPQFLSWLMVKTPGLLESTWAAARLSRGMTRWLLVNIFHDPKSCTPEILDEVYAEVKKPFAGWAFTRQQRDEVLPKGLRTVYLSRLNEIKIPTLILHGQYDKAVPLACAEEAHSLIAGSELSIIPDAGHWPQREKPQEFLQALLGFLRD